MRYLLALLLLVPGMAWGKEQPNIVYVLVDNWGWGDISVQGSGIATPEIDALAADGLRLTNFNIESQCTPTRSAIMTGRLPIRSGTHRVTYGLPYGLAPWEYTLPELLSDEGYSTALFGKWHLGDVEGRFPTDQGFDIWWGLPNTTDEAGYSATPQFDPQVMPLPSVLRSERNGLPERVEPLNLENRVQLDHEIIRRSEAYIHEQAKQDNPFFLYVGLTQVHPPFLTHPDFSNTSGHGIYGDILKQLDHHVGQLLYALDNAGIAEETIVILTGDNGAVTDGAGGGSTGPFRAGFTGYEGGLRTPAMVRWPGKIASSRISDEIFASVDWLPTIAGLINAKHRIPSDRPIDGLDLSEFLLDEETHSDREHVVFYIGDDLFSVKWRSFKIHLKTAESLWSPVQEYMFPPIYDVANDPGEANNLLKHELFAHTWVYTPMGKILGELAASMKDFPNISPGAEFDGYNN